jgi:hypothetical protein
MKNRNLTKEHKAKLLEHLKILHGNAEYQLKRLENLKIYLYSKENLEHLNRLNADPKYRAKRSEHLKRLHSSAEHKEHLNRLHENLAISLKGRPKPKGSGRPNVSIEVLDSLNNEIKVYPTIKEAAVAIGVNPSSISKAFKCLPEGESTILIKKNDIKLLNCYSLFIYIFCIGLFIFFCLVLLARFSLF